MEEKKDQEVTNGFEMLARAYEKMLKDDLDEFELEDIKKHIKIFRVLAPLNEEEINMLFDTTAFNSIAYGYLLAAAKNADMTEEQVQDLRNGLNLALSEMKAKQARRLYEID